MFITVRDVDSRLRMEAVLKFEGYRCTDNRFIIVLVTNGNIIGNSQTAKQWKDCVWNMYLNFKG